MNFLSKVKQTILTKWFALGLILSGSTMGVFAQEVTDYDLIQTAIVTQLGSIKALGIATLVIMAGVVLLLVGAKKLFGFTKVG